MIQSQLDRTVIRHIYNEQTVQQVEKILEGGTHIFIKFSEFHRHILEAKSMQADPRISRYVWTENVLFYSLRNA